jgi:DNA-binding GntR family transcriptional regulator
LKLHEDLLDRIRAEDAPAAAQLLRQIFSKVAEAFA